MVNVSIQKVRSPEDRCNIYSCKIKGKFYVSLPGISAFLLCHAHAVSLHAKLARALPSPERVSKADFRLGTKLLASEEKRIRKLLRSATYEGCERCGDRRVKVGKNLCTSCRIKEKQLDKS